MSPNARSLCEHERTIFVHGQVNETVGVKWPGGHWSDRYFGDVPGLINGDDIQVEVCLDCQKVLGMASADKILAMDPGPPPPPRKRDFVHEFKEECQVCGGSPDGCPACSQEGE